MIALGQEYMNAILIQFKDLKPNLNNVDSFPLPVFNVFFCINGINVYLIISSHLTFF